MYCIFFSVVYIKEEFEDDAHDVQNEPLINSLLAEECFTDPIIVEKKREIIETNNLMDKSVPKEELLSDDLVSNYLYLRLHEVSIMTFELK